MSKAAYTAKYAADPRARWTPAIGDYLGMTPAQMEHLTPEELDAAEKWVSARMKSPQL